jgi:hypothetical protein
MNVMWVTHPAVTPYELFGALKDRPQPKRNVLGGTAQYQPGASGLWVLA